MRDPDLEKDSLHNLEVAQKLFQIEESVRRRVETL